MLPVHRRLAIPIALLLGYIAWIVTSLLGLPTSVQVGAAIVVFFVYLLYSVQRALNRM